LFNSAYLFFVLQPNDNGDSGSSKAEMASKEFGETGALPIFESFRDILVVFI